jgi:type I restriction enzyme R subunit
VINLNKFDIIIENIDSTVVSSYESKRVRQTEYQSEADLENALIKQLKNQGYEYLNAKTPNELILNLRSTIRKIKQLYI